MSDKANRKDSEAALREFLSGVVRLANTDSSVELEQSSKECFEVRRCIGPKQASALTKQLRQKREGTTEQPRVAASSAGPIPILPPGSLFRFWRLFSYILPRSTRERVFEPAFQDLQADYLETRGKYRTAWAKRWLRFCFGVRTVLMVGGCLRAWVQDAIVSWLMSFVPAEVRRWFRSS